MTLKKSLGIGCMCCLGIFFFLTATQPAAAQMKLDFKLGGGAGLLFGGGDLEKARLGYQQNIQYILDHDCYSSTFNWKKMSFVPNFDFDTILAFGQKFGLGFGTGYISGKSPGDHSHTYVAQKDLTPSQLKEFNSRKLSIELQGVGMGSYGSGSISYSSWVRWKGYQGSKSISESELYRIAGYEDLAIQANKRVKRGKTLFFTGLGIMAGGLAVMLASEKTLGLGGAIAVAGMVPAYMSIPIRATNLKPYGVVSGIVDEYNLQLNLSIKKKFQ